MDDLERLVGLVLGPELDPIRGTYGALSRRILDISAGIDFDLSELRTLRLGLGKKEPSVFLPDEIGSWQPGDGLEVREGEDSHSAETSVQVRLEALLARALSHFEEGFSELHGVRTLSGEMRQNLRVVLARLSDEERRALEREALKPRPPEERDVLTHRELAGLRESFAFALPSHTRRGLHPLLAGSFADSEAVLGDDERGYLAVELRALARDLQYVFDKLETLGVGEDVAAEDAGLLSLARGVTRRLAPILGSLREALGGTP